MNVLSPYALSFAPKGLQERGGESERDTRNKNNKKVLPSAASVDLASGLEFVQSRLRYPIFSSLRFFRFLIRLFLSILLFCWFTRRYNCWPQFLRIYPTNGYLCISDWSLSSTSVVDSIREYENFNNKIIFSFEILNLFNFSVVISRNFIWQMCFLIISLSDICLSIVKLIFGTTQSPAVEESLLLFLRNIFDLFSVKQHPYGTNLQNGAFRQAQSICGDSWIDRVAITRPFIWEPE